MWLLQVVAAVDVALGARQTVATVLAGEADRAVLPARDALVLATDGGALAEATDAWWAGAVGAATRSPRAAATPRSERRAIMALVSSYRSRPFSGQAFRWRHSITE